MGEINKARYWCAVLYNENMVDGWQNDIGDIVQLPYAYCIHNKDMLSDGQEERKVHTHIILAFSNTTTYKHAFSVFDKLSKDGCSALNKIVACINVRNMYDYLIHNTETCRKNNKYLYPVEERICGNNFDIGAFEQIGLNEKNALCKELCNIIVDNGFTNFADFYLFVVNAYDDSNYFDILKSYSGLFERLTRANYQKYRDKTFFSTTTEKKVTEDERK